MLTIGQTFSLISLIQSGTQPGGLIAFNDEGAGDTTGGIGMHLKEAMLVGAKNKGEGIKDLVCAKPDIARITRCDLWLKLLRQGLTHHTVDAVGSDEQIVLAHVGEGTNLAIEREDNAEFGATLLENVQEQFARDAGDDVSSAANDCGTIVDIDGIPDHKMIGNLLVTLIVGALK